MYYSKQIASNTQYTEIIDELYILADYMETYYALHQTYKTAKLSASQLHSSYHLSITEQSDTSYELTAMYQNCMLFKLNNLGVLSTPRKIFLYQ